MTASQSDLSAPRYGYDFVVATSQASINATMKEFLAGVTEPVVTRCYIADAAGKPTEIPYAQLVKTARGSDPFMVPPGADPSTNADLKNLLGARFMMGFRAELGLPSDVPPEEIPDIVTLGGSTSAVTFNHLCSQFTVVELEPGSGYAPASWMNESQPSDRPWLFTSKVDLRLSRAEQNAYSKLPKPVQDQIKNLGGNAFSVQQLLFDLDNAALESMPTISGVKPGTKLYMILEQEFLGAYFAQMQATGQPFLGCAITQTTVPISTLTLTDLNMEVCPLLGTNGQPILNPTREQQDVATLSYLCAANGDPLPAPVTFGWNWIETSERSDYDGVVSVNRRAFATYLKNQLQPYVSNNSYLAGVHVWLDSNSTTWFDPPSLIPGQTPTVNMPETGPVLLTFHYDSSAADQAGLNGDLGRMELKPSFDLIVSASGTTLTVAQHLVVYVYVRSLATSGSGSVVDVKLIDTYTLAVSQDGELVAKETTEKTDQSKNPSTDPFLNWFTNLNAIIDMVETVVRGMTATTLRDLPLSIVQDYVFPGGKTFAYKSVAFSGSADLAAHITYTEPT
jgi:hypothetical protein